MRTQPGTAGVRGLASWLLSCGSGRRTRGHRTRVHMPGVCGWSRALATLLLGFGCNATRRLSSPSGSARWVWGPAEWGSVGPTPRSPWTTSKSWSWPSWRRPSRCRALVAGLGEHTGHADALTIGRIGRVFRARSVYRGHGCRPGTAGSDEPLPGKPMPRGAERLMPGSVAPSMHVHPLRRAPGGRWRPVTVMVIIFMARFCRGESPWVRTTASPACEAPPRATHAADRLPRQAAVLKGCM